MDPVGRVALVMATSTGGTGRHVACLVEGLTRAGTPVTVFAPRATERAFGFVAAGARFHPIEIPVGPRPADLMAVYQLRTALRDPDIVVIHAHGLRAGLVAALAKASHQPLVVTWHNFGIARGVRGWLYRGWESRIARAADVTLGVSSDLVERARKLGGRDVRLAVVPAPPLPRATRSPQHVRTQLGIPPDRHLVFSAGRLHPQKGYEVLIDAAARWRGRKPGIEVLIAGDGPLRERLTAQIARLDAPVRLLGHRRDMSDLLAAADVVVTTSVWEGQPLFVQEALRAGAVLVATAVGGIPDIVGDSAVLVPYGDPSAVDAAVTTLLDDPATREWYARRGPERAATWPGEPEAHAQARSVYSAVVARRRGRR